MREFGHATLERAGGVLDVAGGGSSALSWELCVRRGASCTVVDPRPLKLKGRRAAALQRRAESADELENAWRACAAALATHLGASAPAPVHVPMPLPIRTIVWSLRLGGRCHPAQLQCLFGDAAHIEAHTELRQAVQRAALLVGFHPDEATDFIVDAALTSRKPFAVVPCCVFPKLFKLLGKLNANFLPYCVRRGRR